LTGDRSGFLTIDASDLPPLVTWGTSPQDVISIEGAVPNPADIADEARRKSTERALDYMGLDKIFIEAGFEWREPGCSMCLAMNADKLQPGERCASTSNRNFEGRQGRGGRTHLVSPEMAAAAAVTGHFTDIRNLKAEG